MIEILKPRAHMSRVFNGNLMAVDLKQVIKEQLLAKANGTKTTPSDDHRTTVSALQTFLPQTLQPTH